MAACSCDRFIVVRMVVVGRTGLWWSRIAPSADRGNGPSPTSDRSTRPAGWVLDDLDKELERRGHKFCRYADDCNIYVQSQAAGERVLTSVTKFLEGRLRLSHEQRLVPDPRLGQPPRSVSCVTTLTKTAGYDEYVRWCGRTAGATPPPTRLSPCVGRDRACREHICNRLARLRDGRAVVLAQEAGQRGGDLILSDE